MDDNVKDALPRCGDVVLHRPTGEEWRVAWAEGEDVVPAKWPMLTGKLADCEMVLRCSDQQHAAEVEGYRRSGSGHRFQVLRLYGERPRIEAAFRAHALLQGIRMQEVHDAVRKLNEALIRAAEVGLDVQEIEMSRDQPRDYWGDYGRSILVFSSPRAFVGLEDGTQ